MQETFQLFDSRGDNKIHISQIGNALRALGQNPTESDVKKFTHQHKPGKVNKKLLESHAFNFNIFIVIILRISYNLVINFVDERISFDVFLPIYQAISKSRSLETADDFIEGLRHFDKDGNGFISSAELRHLLTTLGNIQFLVFMICRNVDHIFFFRLKNIEKLEIKLFLNHIS